MFFQNFPRHRPGNEARRDRARACLRGGRQVSRQAGALLPALLLFGLLPAPGQNPPSERKQRLPQAKLDQKQPKRQKQQGQRQKDQLQHPPGFLQRLRDLPPDEQERVLQNNARFQRLPPERQEKVRENLRRWNSLSPRQKEVIRQREEILRNLSPEQRQELRSIYPSYHQLPPDRQHQVMRAFTRLHELPPAQRARLLSSRAFREHFSPEEQQIIRRLAGLLPQ